MAVTPEQLDELQMSLMAGGFAPGPVGVASDLGDAGVSLYRAATEEDTSGHLLNALLAGGAALPFGVGMLVGGMRAAKRAKKASAAFKAKIAAYEAKTGKILTKDEILDVFRNLPPEEQSLINSGIKEEVSPRLEEAGLEHRRAEALGPAGEAQLPTTLGNVDDQLAALGREADLAAAPVEDLGPRGTDVVGRWQSLGVLRPRPELPSPGLRFNPLEVLYPQQDENIRIATAFALNAEARLGRRLTAEETRDITTRFFGSSEEPALAARAAGELDELGEAEYPDFWENVPEEAGLPGDPTRAVAAPEDMGRRLLDEPSGLDIESPIHLPRPPEADVVGRWQSLGVPRPAGKQVLSGDVTPAVQRTIKVSRGKFSYFDKNKQKNIGTKENPVHETLRFIETDGPLRVDEPNVRLEETRPWEAQQVAEESAEGLDLFDQTSESLFRDQAAGRHAPGAPLRPFQSGEPVEDLTRTGGEYDPLYEHGLYEGGPFVEGGEHRVLMENIAAEDVERATRKFSETRSRQSPRPLRASTGTTDPGDIIRLTDGVNERLYTVTRNERINVGTVENPVYKWRLEFDIVSGHGAKPVGARRPPPSPGRGGGLKSYLEESRAGPTPSPEHMVERMRSEQPHELPINRETQSYFNPHTLSYRPRTLADEMTAGAEATRASYPPPSVTKPGKIYHGTRSSSYESFIDENGNLVLKPSKNFGGKQHGVSFTEDLDRAWDYAARTPGAGPRRSRLGKAVFEIDKDAVPNELFIESGEEIATRGAETVVIPKGKFRTITDSTQEKALVRWERARVAEVKKLSNKSLGEEAAATDAASEMAEFRGDIEGAMWTDTPLNNAILYKYGSEPEGSFVQGELRARYNASKDPEAFLDEIEDAYNNAPNRAPYPFDRKWLRTGEIAPTTLADEMTAGAEATRAVGPSQATFRNVGSGYQPRTRVNAKETDATIALAVDFSSYGEIATKKAAKDANKAYIKAPLDPLNWTVSDKRVEAVVDRLNDAKASSLNIAGNGIYSLRHKGISQKAIDIYVKELIEKVTNHPKLKKPLTRIQSGGQTGVDEAGAKAGMALGIDTVIVAPKDWRFRGIDGKDIADKEQFMARFKE